MTQPLISVLICAYNAEDTIERAVHSLLTQDYPHWEAIIVDAASSDRTVELVEELQRLHPDKITVVPLAENGGISTSRNRALAEAKGEWFSFLDADDEYTPERLSTMVAAIDDGVDIVACRHHIVQTDGTSRIRGDTSTPDLSGRDAMVAILNEERFQYLWDKLFRAEWFAGVGFPTLNRAEDNVYVIACCRRARIVRYISPALYRYYVSPTSLTWSRVSTIDETNRLLGYLTEAAGDMAQDPQVDRALRVARVLGFLASAHQGIAALDSAKGRIHARQAAQEIGWCDVAACRHSRTTIGVAAALLKLASGLYISLYRSYIKRKYGLS